jgi:alpha-L-fucosidase 2
VADYQALFSRVSLNLGTSPEKVRAHATEERLADYAAGGSDPELEALFFQFGRYLLISSSRPCSLPANLQGLWNDSNNPPWRSDYHSNINVQMNYWLAESPISPNATCRFSTTSTVSAACAWRPLVPIT